MRSTPSTTRSEIDGYTPQALRAAALFALVGLCLQAWRSHVLLASYDQGIFQQVLWSTLNGHPFESTLSSQLSTNVIHSGQLPTVGYQRLGQHFTPALLLWVPLLGLIGGAALPIVQVGLITLAGLVLHRFARVLLPPRTANWITYGYFCGTALIGPTLGNFTDLCQLPLAVFALMLGLQKRNWWLITPAALLIPLIREDTGVMLVAIGLWLLLRHRQRWRLALLLSAYGAGWMLLTTNTLMPLFSDDNAKRFMVENFGQYLQPSQAEGVNSIGVIRQIITNPLLLLKELVEPPAQTLLYLLGQALPFLFVPLICLDTWILSGPSLLGLFLAQGSNDPLSITIRYTLLVVPGFSLAAVLWWSRQQERSPNPRMRLLWSSCLTLALLLTLSSNPNRSLSFLIPDSLEPMVYSSPVAQWHHGVAAREALAIIPAEASVAATTPLVPLLAKREVLVRYPFNSEYVARDGQPKPVEWIAVDINWVQRYGQAFSRDWRQLRNIRKLLGKQLGEYQVQALNNGIVVLELNGQKHPQLNDSLRQLLNQSMPTDPRTR